MAEPSDHEVTKLLAAVRGGDNQAFERLYPMVYDELRRAARRQLAGERMGHTLDTAGLVNEAYLKLVDAPNTPAEGRQHFVRIAARAMRQVLVDHARKRRAEKRGGEWVRTSQLRANSSARLRRRKRSCARQRPREAGCGR
ncbi:MAG: ECF-type sigma factor [Bryobacterales bacterium]